MEPGAESVVQNSISELWEYCHPGSEYDLNTVFPSGVILAGAIAKAKATTISKIGFIVNHAPWRVVLVWACWCVERAMERDRSAGRDPHILAGEVTRRALQVAIGDPGSGSPVMMSAILATCENLGHSEVAAYQVGLVAEDAIHGRWASCRALVRAAVREAAEIDSPAFSGSVDREAREAEHVVQLTRLVELVAAIHVPGNTGVRG